MEELKRCRNEEISLEIRYVIAKAIQRKTMELEKTIVFTNSTPHITYFYNSLLTTSL